MIRIKVSYEQPKELYRVLKLLGDEVKKYKSPKTQDGKYKKVYIELK